MMRSRVDLPQPEGPTSEMNSPFSIRKSMPFRTSVPSKDLRIAESSICAMRAGPLLALLRRMRS